MNINQHNPDEVKTLTDALSDIEGRNPTVEEYRAVGRIISELHLDAHQNENVVFDDLHDITNEVENTLLALAHRDETLTTEHVTTLTNLLHGDTTVAETDLPNPSLDAFNAVAQDDELQQACEDILATYLS